MKNEIKEFIKEWPLNDNIEKGLWLIHFSLLFVMFILALSEII